MNSKDNTNDKAEKEQLKWIEAQLSHGNTHDRKFILHMHIPPGMWYYQSEEVFWKNQSQNAFLNILSKYQNNLSFLLAAHIHSGEIRAPISTEVVDLKNLTIMMTPAVSPLFKNNPGYSILKYSDEDVTRYEITWHFL
jgi:sphingomyelin phosphodiesterase acid-like 3